MTKKSNDSPALAPHWQDLPTGAWFLLESADCVEKFSVQERTGSGYKIVCSTPYWHPVAKANLEEIVASHNSRPALAEPAAPQNELRELRELLGKITPGPWEVTPTGYRVMRIDRTSDGAIVDSDYICDTASNKATRTKENAANARLIAMAPDLLKQVLAGAAPSSVQAQDELEHVKSQRDYLQRVCSKIQTIVDQSGLPDRSSELYVLPSSVAILEARASSPSSATEQEPDFMILASMLCLNMGRVEEMLPGELRDYLKDIWDEMRSSAGTPEGK